MSLRAVAVSWARSGRIVLDGVTVDPVPGSTVGLLGPNGSGKSSLLRLMAGIDRPDAGSVQLDGRALHRMSRRAVARRVAMVGQHADTDLDIAVSDVVRLGRIPHGSVFGSGDDDAAVAAAMAATGLDGMAERMWHTLSGGERQRVQIARALAQEPGELLLDEPTNHLDVAHQLEILAMVRALDVTSVVALHDLNLAAMFCDHVVVLSQGSVVAAGSPVEVLTETLVADVYGVRCRITVDAAGPYVRFEHGGAAGQLQEY
ncbi:histidinol phosphatase [Mycolicibacterium conceptionense]|jgi:iron complex transport system ATP-binding protein|uniref:Histidinol phosphatase n=3 Tax=Mycolicibacterium TaxID=1866885 RepID=A0A0J8UG84_9MYCO|nr:MULTISPECIES: ABC transporter ATP-binding protein [Mycolicibacterium]KLI07288.1 histidinol phosphatase [Mycolicibacterium senegalense]KLO48621.1 histidinol phosphatase [Mycolicibacterium senegalense]KMV20231.1 histidinol phosphatase [Mycolicibacterium conceptionense]MCW1821510.1 ABC transporter ATP-binding protein [Mycolicibacterium senegalense]OBB04363.1 histidinol phosphatase [Mycolicibacterium conceptionense]